MNKGMRELSADRHAKLAQFVYVKLCKAQMVQRERYIVRWERWLVLLAPKAMIDTWPDRFRLPQ